MVSLSHSITFHDKGREDDMLSWAIQIPAAAAVIYVVVFTLPKFLNALESMGKRWDQEREQSREAAEAERHRFEARLESKERAWAVDRDRSREALMATISLAHKMVDNCQISVPVSDRVSADDICTVGNIKRKRS
jgi:hypothetical protein